MNPENRNDYQKFPKKDLVIRIRQKLPIDGLALPYSDERKSDDNLVSRDGARRQFCSEQMSTKAECQFLRPNGSVSSVKTFCLEFLR